MSGEILFTEDIGRSDLEFFADQARSVEIVREEKESGQLGSFGFTLVEEKPPEVGIVVPGGPAEKAGLSKGDIVLSVNGTDVTVLSHHQVTNLIRQTKSRGVWLSVCEGTSNQSNTPPRSLKNSYSPSVPILNNYHHPRPDQSFRKLSGQQRSQFGTNESLISSSPTSYSSDIMARRLGALKGGMHHYGTTSTLNTSPPKSSSASTFSNIVPKAMMNEGEYVALVPPPPLYTRLSVLLNYVGPVQIPESWSARGVSSRCIQECARQLLSKKQAKDFIKVQLEVSQTSLRITSIQGNILVKHRRNDLFFCGLCSNDEQYFAIVTRATTDKKPGTSDLCHIFKLLPDSRLSTYWIDRKKSNRETKSGPEVPVKSCTNITNAIQSIYKSEEQSKASPHKRIELTMSSDNVEYGVIKGVSMFKLQSGDNGSSPSHSSPSPSKKRLDVIDLRPQGKSPPKTHKRTGSNPMQMPSREHEFTPSPLTHSSVGIMGNGLHVRMGSDGSNSSHSSSSSNQKPQPVPFRKGSFQRDHANRISDSSLSSYSSDQSGHRSRSNSPTPTKHQMSPTKQSMIPSPQHFRKISLGRKTSMGMNRLAVSPTHEAAMMSARGQLRRQSSETSLLDLTAGLPLSPYHHFGLPSKNSGLSSSVDSIITVTTLAGEGDDDDVDASVNEVVVGRVAGWCANFNRLLEDPLGVECLQKFLMSEHSEENILFWKDVQEYKKTPSANLQEAAKRVYESYLSPSAPNQINIDDRVLKEVEANLARPTVQLFSEAESQIYQLMKLDCHPRFSKSQLIKDCICAEMEGRPLPVVTTDTMERKTSTKALPHSRSASRSLFSRRRVPSPSGLSPEEHRRSSKKEKKGKSSKDDSSKKAAQKESPASEQDNLVMLQAHRKNLFEVNMPNRVTKIVEVPSSGNVRTAVTNVLKKYNYSLDVMEIKNASTLQPIPLDEPASILTGKHISVIRSKNTVTVTFPDLNEMILAANGSCSLRSLFDGVLSSQNKTNSYSVFLEGARAPLELDMDTSILAGHTVTIKYLSGPVSSTVSTPPKKGKHGKGGDLSSSSSSSLSSNSSKSSKVSQGVEELFSMIERLNVGGSMDDQRMPDRYSPDPSASKESTPTPTKDKSPTTKKKSPLKFTRVKSSSAIPNKKKLDKKQSSPPVMTGSHSHENLLRATGSIPFPGGHQHSLHVPSGRNAHFRQTSADRLSGISTGSGSSADSAQELAISDQRQATRQQLREWMARGQDHPRYFPDAFGSGMIDASQSSQQGEYMMAPQDRLRTASLNRGYYTIQHPPHRLSPSSSGGHPLDHIVTEAYQKKGTWPPSQASQMAYNDSVGVVATGGNPMSSYPWRQAHNYRPTRVSGLEDSQTSEASSASSQPAKPPLSPTTHVLVVDDQSSETFV